MRIALAADLRALGEQRGDRKSSDQPGDDEDGIAATMEDFGL